MSAFSKTVFRTVKNNLGRFAAMTAIILLGIAFVSGLGALSPKILDSLDSYLTQSKTADIIVKTTSPQGFSQQEIQALTDVGGVEIEPITAMDLTVAEKNARIYVMPLGDMRVNHINVIEGRLPKTDSEILVERPSDFVKKIEIDQTVELLGKTMTVVGISANPLLFCKLSEPDIINQEPLELIAYIDSNLLGMPLALTDVYIRVKDADGINVFSDKYKSKIDTCVAAVGTALGGGDTFRFLSLRENKSFALIESYTDKVNIVCLIFPVFFILVASLVVLTTMTRLIEEERAAIGCYKVLGYSDGKIAFKYIGFAVLCCLLGAAIGIVAGVLVLPAVLYPAFHMLFFMPAMVGAVQIVPGLIAAAAMLAAVAGVTAYLISRELHVQPAELLRPKAPKAGKKIFLERIAFLWKRLSFRLKSTFRNIFRYVKHLVMTVVSVAGSTALVLAGFGLSDTSRKMGMSEGAGGMAESFSMISTVVIIFAALLCILVIYNLTNMNIGERKREIATLKVLGYYDAEVAGYIYREIFVMALFGIAVGLPLGYGLLYFVFTYMDFGNIKDVAWYSFLFAAGIVVLFIGIVDLLLHRKMKNIDMTSSLKTND